ncbi:MAG: tRNA 2-selenouridine(34) synthase MnmH [Planctomycetales bacterium]|nr:tRNA 2-selenouridine(34) synthase MnmH [Planctomycetales bacterium]
MTRKVDIHEVLCRAGDVPLIDVRSPAEFAAGHIPGANNVALFDDAERSEIGTLYKQAGREEAVTRGLAIAGPKAGSLVGAVRELAADRRAIVHCWRGGMRSEAFAWMLHQCEFDIAVLQGGYKSFRRAAHAEFESHRSLVTISGMSGSGKTQLLHALRDSGEQVLDLEAMANHRGSAFGGIGLPPQPTVEQFENELFLQWRNFDPDRPVWVESESQTIGRVYIPNPIFEQMVHSPAVVLEVDFEKRAEFLVQVYGGFQSQEFAASIEKIKKRLGGERYQRAMNAVERNDVLEVARISLEYYDRGYQRASAKWAHRESM